jgi:hypothetical protein
MKGLHRLADGGCWQAWTSLAPRCSPGEVWQRITFCLSSSWKQGERRWPASPGTRRRQALAEAWLCRRVKIFRPREHSTGAGLPDVVCIAIGGARSLGSGTAGHFPSPGCGRSAWKCAREVQRLRVANEGTKRPIGFRPKREDGSPSRCAPVTPRASTRQRGLRNWLGKIPARVRLQKSAGELLRSVGNGGQCATAATAPLALSATRNLQVADSKGRPQVRIPPSPPATNTPDP